jgi:hypothetical protein
MRIMQETTKWSSNSPNHIYVFDDKMNHIIAYVPNGSNKVFKFKAPLRIDQRGRTFVELEKDAAEEPAADTWQVPGSNGKTYTVSREAGGGMNYQCTCPGFLYRNSCKHVAEFQMSHSIDIR